MNNRISPTFLVLACMAGCTTSPPRVEHVQVPVPVACPVPTLPAKPQLPLANLPLTATDDETVRAYAESLRLCALYSKQLEIVLKAYLK